MSLDPSVISEGEPVVIQDTAKNVARGIAEFDNEGFMVLRAFSTDIRFARWSTSARGGLGGYSVIKGIKIIGHEPPIGHLSWDVVPRQHFGGNPT